MFWSICVAATAPAPSPALAPAAAATAAAATAAPAAGTATVAAAASGTAPTPATSATSVTPPPLTQPPALNAAAEKLPLLLYKSIRPFAQVTSDLLEDAAATTGAGPSRRTLEVFLVKSLS